MKSSFRKKKKKMFVVFVSAKKKRKLEEEEDVDENVRGNMCSDMFLLKEKVSIVCP